MSSKEDIIKRILALKPQLTSEAVERLIDEERAKAGGLLTEEAAAHLVASNLGLDGAGERIEAKLRIGDLTSGLSDVSVTARVIHIFPSRTFTRSDNREGKVLRMLVGDSTGSVAVVFWDAKADHVTASKIEAGKIVRILHGYTRERQGVIEINIGNRGQIYMEPMDAVEEKFPEIESFYKTPNEINSPGVVNVIGVVVDRYPTSTFTRKDNSEGKVTRLVVEEGGARLNLVLWDDKSDEAEGVNVGTKLRLLGGNARRREDGSLEVHTSWGSVMEILEAGVKPLVPVSHWTKLADLKTGMYNVNVAARVAQIGESREFARSDGSSGRVLSVLLEDETGTVRLSLWDEDVELAKELEPGTTIAVENGYTRLSLGSVGLNKGRNGELIINPDDVEVAPIRIEDKLVDIRDLREGQTNVYVRGRVLEIPEIREVETARGPATVASFRIDDGTGEARVSVWRDLVDQVEGLAQGAQIRMENCQVREPFDGLLQVSSGMFTRIVVEKK
ncbi:MAG TPA: OB-fold nucleic acid binding domain-containing protein [Patescibacteria group bacterium]|nr:OB-fold nucleic acid binding domain-containing protein [Patescibacteria group bacterium]